MYYDISDVFTNNTLIIFITNATAVNVNILLHCENHRASCIIMYYDIPDVFDNNTFISFITNGITVNVNKPLHR